MFLSWEVFPLLNYAMVTSFQFITVGLNKPLKYFVGNVSLVGSVFSFNLCRKIRWHLLEDQADPEKQEKNKVMESYDK